MADNVFNPVVDHFVSNRYRLFRVTGIVIFHHDQFVAFHAAFGIDICNRLLCASKFLIAILRYRTGHRADDSNFNILSKRHIAQRQGDTSCQ